MITVIIIGIKLVTLRIKMRKIGLILALSSSIYAFNMDINGYIRGGYQNFQDNNIDKSDSAISGKLKLNISNESYGFITSLYGVKNLGDINNIGIPFYSTNNKSYGIIGEAYIEAKISKTKIKIGRQEIDTPFINSDDVSMIPNFYEGITLISEDISNSKIITGYIYKWAGVDSNIIQKFSRINSDDGVEFLGIIYSGFENIELNSWFYNIENIATVTYLSANYNFKIQDIDIMVAGEYSNQDYDNGDNSKIYGILLESQYKKFGINTKLAYNKSDGIESNNFFGGGVFFTNAEHLTISDAGPNGEALMVGSNLDLSKIGIDGLSLGISYLTLERDLIDDINELDLTIEYNYNNDLSMNLIYSDIEDKANDNNSFKDIRVFIQYDF
jgi:hypothetical protein